MSVTFFNDYAATNVEVTLRAAIVGSSDTGVAVVAKPTNAAAAATNPRFAGDMLIDGDLQVVNIGAVGGLQDITVSFVPYGTFAVTTTSS